MFKNVEYESKDVYHLEELLKYVKENTSEMEGVELRDIYFPDDIKG